MTQKSTPYVHPPKLLIVIATPFTIAKSRNNLFARDEQINNCGMSIL